LGQQTQQRSLTLKQAAQHAWNEKGFMTVRHGSDNLACKFFIKEDVKRSAWQLETAKDY
jgi:hypothetical protein